MKITESMIKNSCSSTIYKRGIECFKEGRVHLKKRSDNLITAVVDGDSLYNVSVHFDNEKISDTFCTCPYHETMHSTCKHIVATLKQHKTEQEEGMVFADENDKIATNLCKSFVDYKLEKEMLGLHFILYINDRTSLSYSMSISADGKALHGIENFLDMYAHGKPFRISKSKTYNPVKTQLSDSEKNILDILSECCENRTEENALYSKSAYDTVFGGSTLKRLLPHLQKANAEIIYNGVKIPDIRFLKENPDIIVDVSATSGEISLSVAERGLALTNNGEYFLYEGIIYETDEEFRSYFMPIYNALNEGGRTHITFRGENTMLFAAHILPVINGKHGVISQGIDDMIVNERPEFTVYFDAYGTGISATIIAAYGTVSVKVGVAGIDDKKIIVRDSNAENEILTYFSDFTQNNGSFYLDDDGHIFNFIKYSIPSLSQIAKIVYSDLFKSIEISDTVNITAGVNYNLGINLLETSIETDLTPSEIYGILQAVKLKQTFYRKQNGSFININDNDKKYIFDLLNHFDFNQNDIKNGKKALPLYNMFYLNSLDGIEKGKALTDYIEKIKSIEPDIPKHLDKVLRFYQKDGIKWLKQLSELGFGGILADDMGLGKTLQVLAFVESEKPRQPVLVVTPSALTYNWYNECCRFTPSLKTLIIDGTRSERERLIESADGYDLIITSYPVLRRDISLYMHREFSYCFIDEAQYIKNPKTSNARSVKKIKASRYFALTGTPIENSLSELWSIFDFVMKGYLFDLKTFRSIYEAPIVKDGNAQANKDLKSKIKPFVLRRMKPEVLSELPEKIEYTVFADLTHEQKQIYMSYLTLAKNKTISLLRDGANRMQILTLLMRLRQICCHPQLFDENYKAESGKLQLLMELTENAIDSGHRILIFSQYTSMLQIIQEELKRKNIRCFYLDGKTPSYERSETADRFNGGERDIFLISLRAGGTGLNLTGADTVIHYDPWWNPAVTDQATDRAYRIGQQKDVQVIRLVSKGTIEEKILKLQQSKRHLADDIVSANSETFFSLSNEEILALLEP